MLGINEIVRLINTFYPNHNNHLFYLNLIDEIFSIKKYVLLTMEIFCAQYEAIKSIILHDLLKYQSPRSVMTSLTFYKI